MSTSQETTCKCGKMKFWITEGQVTKKTCPECGRKYFGKYNPKTYHIDAIEFPQELKKKKKRFDIIKIKWRILLKAFNPFIWFLNVFNYFGHLDAYRCSKSYERYDFSKDIKYF